MNGGRELMELMRYNQRHLASIADSLERIADYLEKNMENKDE